MMARDLILYYRTSMPDNSYEVEDFKHNESRFPTFQSLSGAAGETPKPVFGRGLHLMSGMVFYGGFY